MLNLKKLDRLFAKFDADPASDHFLALLRETARLKAEYSAATPDWTQQEYEEALHGEKPLVASRTIDVKREDFLRVFELLLEAARKAGAPAEELEGMPSAETLFTDEVLQQFVRRPDSLWEALNEADIDTEQAEFLFVPIAVFALRVFFDDAAAEASATFERMVPDTVHFERSLTCPVCGTYAGIASVGATQNHGNVKHLHCVCCGASWQFERIRCATCGTEAASDLEYTHFEGDDKHRLHVCSACGSAVPTVFGAESEDFDPDFEQWRSAQLMVAYYEQQADSQNGSGTA